MSLLDFVPSPAASWHGLLAPLPDDATPIRTLLEGAGVQFLNFDEKSRDRLQNYVYELVEDTLTKANLI